MFVDQFMELSFVDVTGSRNNDVLTDVEFLMEFLDLLRGDRVDVVPDSP